MRSNIRPERPEDAAAVRALLDAAFGGDVESKVVERLRADGDFVLSLVAESGEGIAGYAGFPRLVLRLDERNVPVVGLAPVGVSPSLQRQGIGSALIRDGFARLQGPCRTPRVRARRSGLLWPLRLHGDGRLRVALRRAIFSGADARAGRAEGGPGVVSQSLRRSRLKPCRATRSSSNMTARRSSAGSFRRRTRRCRAR